MEPDFLVRVHMFICQHTRLYGFQSTSQYKHFTKQQVIENTIYIVSSKTPALELILAMLRFTVYLLFKAIFHFGVMASGEYKREYKNINIIRGK